MRKGYSFGSGQRMASLYRIFNVRLAIIEETQEFYSSRWRRPR